MEQLQMPPPPFTWRARKRGGGELWVMKWQCVGWQVLFALIGDFGWIAEEQARAHSQLHRVGLPSSPNSRTRVRIHLRKLHLRISLFGTLYDIIKFSHIYVTEFKVRLVEHHLVRHTFTSGRQLQLLSQSQSNSGRPQQRKWLWSNDVTRARHDVTKPFDYVESVSVSQVNAMETGRKNWAEMVDTFWDNREISWSK